MSVKASVAMVALVGWRRETLHVHKMRRARQLIDTNIAGKRSDVLMSDNSSQKRKQSQIYIAPSSFRERVCFSLQQHTRFQLPSDEVFLERRTSLHLPGPRSVASFPVSPFDRAVDLPERYRNIFGKARANPRVLAFPRLLDSDWRLGSVHDR